MLAKEQEASKHLKQLIAIVGVPPGQTSDASVLQSDRVFRQNLQHYAETRNEVEDLLTKLPFNHPEVIAGKGKLQAVQSALLTRSSWLLGKAVSREILHQLSVNISSSTASWKSRESLLQELKQVKIDRQRLKNRLKELDQQIAQLKSQQELENKQVVPAEAVGSTCTKLDLSNGTSNFHLPLQTTIKPSLIEKSSPSLKLILLAALSQSQQWFTQTTQRATLVLLLGLAGGSWVTNELFAPQIAQAGTARIDLSVQSQPNESYETLVSRAEAAMQTVVEDSWKNTQVTSVTVMVMADNYGAIAPVLAMEVSRSQWNASPNVQRWGTYFTSARSLLGFRNVATTTASEIVTDTAVAEEPEDSFGGLETDAAATTYNQDQTSGTEQDSIIADATVPFEDVATTAASETNDVAEELEDTSVYIDTDNATTPKQPVPTAPTSLPAGVKAPVAASANPPKEFAVTNKVIKPQIVQRETTHIDLSVQSLPNESYETLLSRAEAATQTVVKENFKKNKQATAVTVMVMAENYGVIAPVMSLEVSRSQWSKSPNIQRWGTYLTSARSLLGLKNVATATDNLATPAEPETAIFKIEQLDDSNSVPETANVRSSQSPNSTSTKLKVSPASNSSTPNQTTAGPRNSQTPTSTNSSSGSTLLSTPTSAPQNSLVTPSSRGTRINNSTQISVPSNITTPTIPNVNFPEPLLDTSRGTDISAPDTMSN